MYQCRHWDLLRQIGSCDYGGEYPFPSAPDKHTHNLSKARNRNRADRMGVRFPSLSTEFRVSEKTGTMLQERGGRQSNLAGFGELPNGTPDFSASHMG